MRRVLTRDLLDRVLRARWLFAVVVLAMVLGTIAITQSSPQALAAASSGETEAISVTDGPGHVVGNNFSQDPSISANGRFVAFDTFARLRPVSSAPAGQPPMREVYVRDTAASTTRLISKAHVSGQDQDPLGQSFDPSISASGRYIAFTTFASNLGATTSGTVLVCDRGQPLASGQFGDQCAFTNLASIGAAEGSPKLSADGTRLAMLQNGHVVVVDLSQDPTTHSIIGFSASFPPAAEVVTANGITFPHVDGEFGVALSADGRWLLRATEYRSDPPPGGFAKFVETILLNDLTTSLEAQRFDLAPDGSFIGDADSGVGSPAISGDGRRIAFVEDDFATTTLVEFTVHTVDRGTASGAKPKAAVASLDVNGATVSGSDPAFSADGRYLAFATDAPNVHNGVDVPDKNAGCDHPVLEADVTPLRSDADPGASPAGRPRPAPADAPVRQQARAPRQLPAANTGISNCDVVVRDLVQDEQRAAAGQPRLPGELASPSTSDGCSPSTCEGNGDSTAPVLDADGSAVAFTSLASDLVTTGDDNNKSDVFKRTFKPVPVVATLDLGNVVIHTPATGTATVSYSGFGPLRITTVTIGGTNAGDFAVFPGQTCTGAVLYPGVTCSVSIRFTPSQLGARSATLTATTNTNVTGVGALRGNGVPEPPPRTPLFQAAPNPLAFGLQQLFTPSVAKTVTVSNPGTGPLSISAVTLVGAAPTNFPGDYQITANTCLAAAVAPGATCTVSVSFAPQAVADRPALLQFTDNAAGSPHLVALTGTGAPPTLVASPPLARSGGVSQVTGTFFPPNKVVVVSLLNTPMQVTVTASPTGTFTVPLVVFPHTPLGKKKLQASVQGVPNPIVVTIDFLVVPGSLQPPDFAERR